MRRVRLRTLRSGSTSLTVGEKMIEHKQVLECYDDLDLIWKEWLTAGKIDLMDTFTRVDVTVTRIEPAKPA